MLLSSSFSKFVEAKYCGNGQHDVTANLLSRKCTEISIPSIGGRQTSRFHSTKKMNGPLFPLLLIELHNNLFQPARDASEMKHQETALENQMELASVNSSIGPEAKDWSNSQLVDLAVRSVNLIEDQETVGALLLADAPGYRLLYRLYVPPENRRKGVATHLVMSVIRKYAEKPIILEPTPFMDGEVPESELRNFYRRLGFVDDITGSRIMIYFPPDQKLGSHS